MIKPILVATLVLSILAQGTYASDTPCVILLHGLARGASAMKPMEKAFMAKDYVVHNIDYPSRKYEISTLSEEAITKGITLCGSNKEIAFITHSMGAILVRDFYSRHPELPQPYRVVMLAPPNSGSQIIDQKWYPKLGARWNGPAGDQLSAKPNSFVNQLPPVTYPTGIIAGNESLEFYNSQVLPGPDDGKVSLASTKVKGMSDWLEVSANHTFIMRNKTVINQTLFFIEHGRFDH